MTVLLVVALAWVVLAPLVAVVVGRAIARSESIARPRRGGVQRPRPVDVPA